MLTLVLWQHVVFLCVSRTVFRISLVMAVRRVLCFLFIIIIIIIIIIIKSAPLDQQKWRTVIDSNCKIMYMRLTDPWWPSTWGLHICKK